jgi:hypothetical protein
MSNEEEESKKRAAATNEETKATAKLTKAQKEKQKAFEEYENFRREQDEKEKQRIDRLRLLTALEGDAAANAGDLANAYKKLNEATEGYTRSTEALSAEQGILEGIQRELQTAEGERRKELIQMQKEAESSIANREQEIEQFEKITKSLREQTKEYRLLSDTQKEQQPALESFFSTLTGGALEAGMAQKNLAFQAGDLAKKLANSEKAGLQLKLAFKQVVNVQNLAAFAFNTVKKATLAMAAAFDQAQAKFAATTGVAKGYNKVLLDVQKAGNKFAISAAEGGDAMAALLAGFNDFHRSAPGVQKDLAIGVAGFAKLGVSQGESSKLMNTLNKTMQITGRQSLQLAKEVGMMGVNIGVSTGKMVKDYQASLSVLAVYGEKSVEVFRGIAAAAKAAGVETSTLLGLAEKFDTFSGAADTTGKLNAILGAQMSATEMLTMTENERIKTLVSSVQATGQAFGTMDRFTQKAIANAAGITDMAEANKIFGMSMSEYENYEGQMEAATMAQQKFDDLLKQVTPALDKFKLIALELAANFAPVLDKISLAAQYVLDTFSEWNEATDGLLGTIVGGVSGIALFVAGMSGLIQSSAAMLKILIIKPYHYLKNLFAKKANTVATLEETVAENANTASKQKNTATEKLAALQKRISIAQTKLDNIQKGINTGVTNTNTVATRANTTAMGGAVPIMLAFGAAMLMIGAGVFLAATGMGNFVAAFKDLGPDQLMAAGLALVGFAAGLIVLGVALGALIYSGVGPVAVPILLGLGAAVMMIGIGVGIAAAGFGYMLESIGTPSVEQYMAFGQSMLMFGAGLLLSAGAMYIFLPALITFMAALIGLAANPLAWAGVGLFGAVAAGIFLIGLGAKMAMDSLSKLISTIADSEGLGNIIGSLMGEVKDVGTGVIVKRIEIVESLLDKVSDADIKSELENIALITTGVSAGLMTENTVSNLMVVSSLADTIKNVFNPDINIELDSAGVEKLFKDGFYKISRGT